MAEQRFFDSIDRHLPDLQLSKRKAQDFLSLLGTGEADEQFTFFTVDDRKQRPKDTAKENAGYEYRDGGGKPNPSPQSFRGTLDDVWSRIEKANRRGAGVFVTVHEHDDSGDRTTETFVRARAVVADLDGGVASEVAPEAYPLAPSFSVQSSEVGRHDYWLLDGAITEEQRLAAHAHLETNFKSDVAIKDMPRVMRLPGTFHRKTDTPFMARMLKHEGEVLAFNAAKIARVFPSPATAVRGAVAKPLRPQIEKLKRGTKSGFQFRSAEFIAMLKFVHERDPSYVATYASWEKVGRAIHAETNASDEGLELFDVWSRWADDAYDADSVVAKWQDYKLKPEGKALRAGSIFKDAAEKYGWSRQVAIATAQSTENDLVEVGCKFDWPIRNSYGKADKESLVNIQFFVEASGLDVYYDEFALKAYVRHGARVLEIDDAMLADLQFEMHTAGLKAGKNIARDGIMRAARKNLRHPVREYLAALEWDGKPRVDKWLVDYVGAKNTALNRAFGRKFLIAAVRRIRTPGEMVRAMPVLEGPQNLGKSKVFRALAVKPEWFTDSLQIGASSKEVIEQTAGHWFVECAEMSGMKKNEVENVKAFVSRTEDVARLSYGHFTSKFPRQFALAGTTNDEHYLKDKTGNTRFWPIKVGKLDIDGLKRDVDQLWAEAGEIEATGEAHWLTDAAMIESAALESEKRDELSPVEEQWVSLLNNAPDCFVAASALWEAVGLDNAKDRTTAQAKSLGAITYREGWRRTKRRVGGQQVGGYVPSDVGADKVERLKEGRYCTFSRAIKTVMLH